MRVLAITNLYPNNIQPDRGVFNRQQFERLASLCELKVIAPVPWYPSFLGDKSRKIFPRDVVVSENINGLEVYHPRHFVSPKIGRSMYGEWMYRGLRGLVERIHETYPFDVIFAAWAYPDAYAAMKIARDLKKPYCVQVHGSDINVFAQDPKRKVLITQALQSSSGVIAVSTALAQKVRDLGVESRKVHLVFSGINKKLFFQKDKVACKKNLGLDLQRKHLVFIGNLVPIKGVTFLIEAMKNLPDTTHLHILGDGELKTVLMEQAKSSGLESRVTFHGRRPHADIPEWMNAADIFCLPSLNEGSPNVILEAMACGTPSVASRVGGIPELLENDSLGMMFSPQDSKEMASVLNKALSKSWDYPAIARHGLKFDWDDNAKTVFQLLSHSTRL